MSEIIPQRDRVPAEFVGLARQFLREVDADDLAAANALNPLLRPVAARQAREPRKHLRDGTLHRVEAAWRAIPRRFRLIFDTKIDKRGRIGWLLEVGIAPCNLTSDDWVAHEPGALIMAHWFCAPRSGRLPSIVTLGTIGMHALARRFQRGRDRSHEAVLNDMLYLAEAQTDQLHGKERFPDGTPFRIPVPHGLWAGEAMVVNHDVPTIKDTSVQLLVRTYLDRD